MLFDDPLSALDASVSAFLMERTLKHELRDKTRVVVTHAVHFLKHADNIICLENGEIVFCGSYEQLKMSKFTHKVATEDLAEQSPPQAAHKKVANKEPKQLEANEVRVLQTSEDKLDPVLSKFAAEDRTRGNLSLGLIHKYIMNNGGYFAFLVIFILNVLNGGMQVYAARYILGWAAVEDATGPNRWKNLGIYVSILYGYCTIALFRSIVHLVLGLAYSRRAHSSMVYRVLHAPVEEFIEKVSMGRLINRFTKDLDVLDKQIVKTIPIFLINFVMVAIDCVFVLVMLDLIVAAPLILFVAFCFFLQRVSMGVKRESMRLEAISKSPIISWAGETIRGLPQIRASNKINYVTRIMVTLLHSNMVNSVLSVGLDCWFKFRLTMVNIFFVQIPMYAYLLYFKFDDPNVANIAMFLLISTILAEDVVRMLTFFNDVEGSFVAVERVTYFEEIPHEQNYLNFDKEFKKMLYVNKKQDLRTFTLPPTSEVVHSGEVVFNNVTARYGTDSEAVLKNLDFKVRPGEKIGIVGRTGAGKSSLIKLFWLSLFPSEGSVTVDGIDITRVDLKRLRNEVMVVSQETALFQGNLAENIDPNMTEEEYPKAMEILNELGIKNKNIQESGVKCKVDADGSNFSQGEKQIICYARTLINQKKIIILDEATANIDVRTEEAIKKIQETKFADSTMFIIAHRLKTVMHCDRIMVLKFGRIVEFDSPQNLLAKPNGLFKEMYDKVMEED